MGQPEPHWKFALELVGAAIVAAALVALAIKVFTD